MLETFFSKTIKWYLIITGFLTFTVLTVAFWPKQTLTGQYGYTDNMLQGFEYWQVIYQHWGIMVAGVGLQLLLSIKYKELRLMAMAFSGFEKACFVYFFITHIWIDKQEWFWGWKMIFFHDSFVTLYSLLFVVYWLTRDKSKPSAHLA
ncbi:hypothetical protein GCM10009007_07140 [Formosimonas limnophila]|uniref:Uncharacterized protein n=1 Tax=Formosimonas limnophila TaxID=1384487 RepID=A0A8J3CG89_9BURK|nr:hypothetical protein [Formosimonas limnophila]GHA68934.1 hypothetical protein GCM10009007_07140 [Formosimonas limnophila]